MKTTVEIPDSLFRTAKATAASRGQLLKDFFVDAVREKLARRATDTDRPAWMSGFGGLAHLRAETARLQSEIDREFRVVEPEDRL